MISRERFGQLEYATQVPAPKTISSFAEQLAAANSRFIDKTLDILRGIESCTSVSVITVIDTFSQNCYDQKQI